MLSRFIAASICIVLALGSARAESPHPTLLIELGTLTDAQMREVLGIFSGPREDAVASVMHNRPLLVVTQAEALLLRERGFAFAELMRDTSLVQLYRRALYGPTLQMPKAYHSYREILATVDSLASQHPGLVRRFEIGRTSQEDQPIVAVSVTSSVHPNVEKPSVLLNGCHHADEVMGAEICLAALRELVTRYGSDSAATAWVDRLEIIIVPVVNVDGYGVVTSGLDPRWRKNTRDTNGNGILHEYPEGVDLNRNYDFNWAHGGSGDSSSVRYRGKFPMSELENQTIDRLAAAYRFLLSITYHSQGEVIYYPWSWRGRPAPDDRLLTEIARELAGSIATMNGDTCYRAEYGAGTVGQSYPFLYGRYGVLDFVVETGRGAHIFPEAEMPEIIASNLEGVWTLLHRAAGPGIALRVTDQLTGEPLDATVWFPDIDTEDIDRRSTQPLTGRHWRLLLPGQHRLIISREGYDPVLLERVDVRPDGWTALDVALRPSQ